VSSDAVFSVVNVRDLPPPHHPFKCVWVGRFRAIEQRLQPVTDGESDHDRELAAGREFLGTLSAWDRWLCSLCHPYHRPNWAAIADESVRILEELGGGQEFETYVAAARRSGLREPERDWLEGLFFPEPIWIIGDHYEYGQHRGCALRFSGAKSVAAVIEEWEGP
jgi:hypothetical protein